MQGFLHYLSLPYLLRGVSFTLQITLYGFVGGLLLGLLLATMSLSRFRALGGIVRLYTVIYRGTPLILQLVFVYTALPHIGITLDPVTAAGVALAANEATFFAEIIRSSVRAVDPGQINAARALGLRPARLTRRIILPQGIRTAVPALGNGAVATMKNSALASIIAVPELTLRSGQLASATFDYFGIYFASGVMYLGLTGLITVIQLTTERALEQDRAPLIRRHTTAGSEVLSTDDPAELPVATDTSRPQKPLGRTVLSVNNIHKSYGEKAVLRGIDLTVRHGEVIALLGPSGSGKSTLLRALNRLEVIDKGVIDYDGIRLGYRNDGTPVPEARVARERVDVGVGMVFQHFNLFSHLTARDNVAFPLRWIRGSSREDADARADQLLAQVGLQDKASTFPRHLSGGQQQRVAIARTLASEPQILLLDEPTSALDPELIHEVLAIIRKLAMEEGITMLIATHQLMFAREVADRVVFITDGIVVEQGPARQVIETPREPQTQRFLRAMSAAGV